MRVVWELRGYTRRQGLSAFIDSLWFLCCPFPSLAPFLPYSTSLTFPSPMSLPYHVASSFVFYIPSTWYLLTSCSPTHSYTLSLFYPSALFPALTFHFSICSPLHSIQCVSTLYRVLGNVGHIGFIVVGLVLESKNVFVLFKRVGKVAHTIFNNFPILWVFSFSFWI